MPEGPVVCDTGPLIALSLIDHLHILQQLFRRVAVPRAVFDEVSAGGGERPGCQAILAVDWFEAIADVTPDPLLAADSALAKQRRSLAHTGSERGWCWSTIERPAASRRVPTSSVSWALLASWCSPSGQG